MAATGAIRMVGAKEAPRSVRSKMDTLLLTTEAIDRWKRPPFQREQRMSKRVVELIAEIRDNGGVIPGVLTLGRVNGDTYLIDGQHRVAAFRESEVSEGIADVRICEFDTVAEMGAEFVKLNSSLVRMKNEDILRALEGTNEHIANLRRRCPFIGYDHIRMAGGVPGNPNQAKITLSMAVAMKSWFGSAGDIPTAGPASPVSADMLDAESAKAAAAFYTACYTAWGGDKQNYRLWGALNIVLLAWMWRRMVLNEGGYVNKTGYNSLRLTPDQFVACLMALSADARYIDWLVGRGINNDRDKAPCFSRIKDTFSRRLAQDGLKSKDFPSGDWVRGGG